MPPQTQRIPGETDAPGVTQTKRAPRNVPKARAYTSIDIQVAHARTGDEGMKHDLDDRFSIRVPRSRRRGARCNETRRVYQTDPLKTFFDFEQAECARLTSFASPMTYIRVSRGAESERTARGTCGNRGHWCGASRRVRSRVPRGGRR